MKSKQNTLNRNQHLFWENINYFKTAVDAHSNLNYANKIYAKKKEIFLNMMKYLKLKIKKK